MESLVAGNLRIRLNEPENVSGAIQLLWEGKSNDRQPAKVLRPYFSDILSVVEVRKVPLELHFEQIEHFNSATITSIIQLIQDSRSIGIKLIIVFDPKLKWQKLSFDALRVFAKADGLLQIRAS